MRRTPPRPPFEGVIGRCNLCGGALAGRQRAWCSQDCADLWLIATNQTRALPFLRRAFGNRCWVCLATEQPGSRPYGFVGPVANEPIALEVDHTRPLWSLSDDERNDLRWWMPWNLTLLCRSCHAAKTRREAGERARLRATPAAASLWDSGVSA